MKLNRQGFSFFSVAVFCVVCVAHAGIFYCAARLEPASIVSTQEKIVKLEVVSLNETKSPQTPSVKQEDQPAKAEPHAPKSAKELTAPKQAPEKQLTARPHETVKTEQKPQLAQQQNIQTTQTSQPTTHTALSATSQAQGDSNKTLTKGSGEKTGTGTDTTASKKGNESSGGSGGGITQRAALISINKIYPEDARRAGITGKVTLAVLVGTNGRAKNVTVVNSSEIRLTASGKKSAELGRYRSAMRNGEKQEESITVIIDYKI